MSTKFWCKSLSFGAANVNGLLMFMISVMAYSNSLELISFQFGYTCPGPEFPVENSYQSTLFYGVVSLSIHLFLCQPHSVVGNDSAKPTRGFSSPGTNVSQSVHHHDPMLQNPSTILDSQRHAILSQLLTLRFPVPLAKIVLHMNPALTPSNMSWHLIMVRLSNSIQLPSRPHLPPPLR